MNLTRHSFNEIVPGYILCNMANDYILFIRKGCIHCALFLFRLISRAVAKHVREFPNLQLQPPEGILVGLNDDDGGPLGKEGG